MPSEGAVKTPSHVIGDCSFNLQNSTEICSGFEANKWNLDGLYPLRVTHIYDLSHFWIVTKVLELEAFQKYMLAFYSKYKKYYHIPIKQLKLNMYCVVHKNETFYRGVLTNVPLLGDGQSLGFVFLIDDGGTAQVPLSDLYFMSEAMFDVPAFAVRASLQGLAPLDGTSWSSGLISEFSKLVSGKLLVGAVTYICETNKVVFLKLAHCNESKYESINDYLVAERLARQLSALDVKEMKRSQKGKHLPVLSFLHPSFEELEAGACTDSSKIAEMLREFQSHLLA